VLKEVGMKLVDLIRVIRHSTLITNESDIGTVKLKHLNYTDNELKDVILITYPSIDPRYVLREDEDIPHMYSYLMLLLAKKEIYLRLATGDARNYPLTAEGASLRKDYIFQHYMSLVRAVNVDYTEAKQTMERNSNIKVSTLRSYQRHLSRDIYLETNRPIVNMRHAITGNTVELSWDKFNTGDGYFWRYDIIASDNQIYDTLQDAINYTEATVYQYYDIHREGTRLELVDGIYHIALAVYLTNGVRGVYETIITVGG
jgi:hypothetical protein